MKSDPRKAAQDMAKALRDVFKQYSYQSRKTAWEALATTKGKKDLDHLLVHPAETKLSDFHKLSFKDWIKSAQAPKAPKAPKKK